ncbi:helix-turn-helix transcriptional regulator [Nonomuraea sediminis]|uniref:helix-turn-helix transcriptional regulator n=1 Tax=Nonomuraea sediminis TaxID=2835864 RepID=UPI001BDC047A|nr:helix-turn-helix transcriptional regulator [Nonomuraea sediminis]
MTHADGRIARDLYAAIVQGGSPAATGAAISQIIGRRVAHDALRLVGLNPATGVGLGVFSFWHEYQHALISDLVLNRYLHGDPCPPPALALLGEPVAVVGAGGCGDTGMRRLLSSHGVGGELRLLIKDRHGPWGLLGLLRAEGARPFSVADRREAQRLVPALVTALRGYVTAGPLTPTVPSLPTGVITVGPDHAVRSISPQARDWMRQMWPGAGSGVPDWIANAFWVGLSLHARTHARDTGAWRPLLCAPAANFGRWVLIHGQPLDEHGDSDVAILIQAAGGSLLLPSFCDWYGITARERRILELLYAGAAPKQIARALDLSAYTVNDHLKSLYGKTGAQGRDELIAAISG